MFEHLMSTYEYLPELHEFLKANFWRRLDSLELIQMKKKSLWFVFLLILNSNISVFLGPAPWNWGREYLTLLFEY